METAKGVGRQKRRRAGIVSVAVIEGGLLCLSVLLNLTASLAGGLPRQGVIQDSPELTQARVKKAKQMRDNWRPWAVKHKSTLHTMLTPVHGKEKEALESAYAALPSHLSEYGDTGIRYRDLDAGGIGYSWQPVTKMHGRATPGNPMAQQAADKEHMSLGKQLYSQYDKFHDIEISRSVNGGPTHITLWASGRITMTTAKVVKVPRGSTLTEETKEIAPPYEEIGR